MPPSRISLLHVIRRRPRLTTALALGVVVMLVVPTDGFLKRLLLGWTSAAWSYLVLIGALLARASRARARWISEQEDPSGPMVLALLSLIAVASLGAIVLELSNARALGLSERLTHYALAGATVFGSWLMLNVLFTFHYAHLYYRSPADARPLRFPDGAAVEPGYWDFLYFAFTIAVAAQTSDVVVVTTTMRKAVLAQSVLVFLFNLAIIGLSINVAAGLIAG
jgi:uncharacterized membrane protein